MQYGVIKRSDKTELGVELPAWSSKAEAGQGSNTSQGEPSAGASVAAVMMTKHLYHTSLGNSATSWLKLHMVHRMF